MTFRYLLAPALAAGLFLTLTQTVAAQTKWTGTADITFSGTSTLHDFSGMAPCDPFAVTVNGAGEDFAQAIISGEAAVLAADMETGNNKRDTNMHKALKVKEFPVIVGVVENLRMKDTSIDAEGAPTALPFTLTLLEKTHQIRATVSHWEREKELVKFTLSFPISLKECGIHVPAVLKVIKVGDEVKVNVAVTLVPAKPETAGKSDSKAGEKLPSSIYK